LDYSEIPNSDEPNTETATPEDKRNSPPIKTATSEDKRVKENSPPIKNATQEDKKGKELERKNGHLFQN